MLLIMIERGGRLVTREELQKKLWPSDTMVDFEHGINAAIKVLRGTWVTLGMSRSTSKPYPAGLSADGASGMDKKWQ